MYMNANFQDYIPELRILRLTFHKADLNSFSDLFSVHLWANDHFKLEIANLNAL